jgi:phosphomannomutase/phosphoglucomutase
MVSTPEIRIDCPDEEKFPLVERVTAHFRGKRNVNDVDGVRITFDHGWGLLRASNTQPALVMRFEATSGQLLEEYRHEMVSAMERARHELSGVTK